MTAEHKYKLVEWSKLIQEQKNSGMTVIEWCRSTGNSKWAYYYWLRRLQSETLDDALASLMSKNATALSTSENQFVEIPLSAPPHPETDPVFQRKEPVAILHVNGIQCGIMPEATQEFMSDLIGALRHAQA